MEGSEIRRRSHAGEKSVTLAGSLELGGKTFFLVTSDRPARKPWGTGS